MKQHDSSKTKERRNHGVVRACAAVGIAAALVLPGAALTPTYDGMTSAFRNSRYYLNLQALTLTGDERTDLVMVAMSQLGYHEGNSSAQCNGENRTGSGNWVEYNYRNGAVDQYGNGKQTYAYPWCASFVSYCARTAGISSAVLPTSVSCARWVSYFSSVGQYRSRTSGYVPRQGDLIFYRSKGATVSDHVGIVRYTCGGMVYTIEGNSDNQVSLKCYALNNTYILGYATPNYRAGAGAINYLLDEYTEGNYIIAAEKLPVRKTPSYSARTTYTLRRGDLMHIYECRDGWGRTDFGWIPMTDTQPIDLYRR